ncbi:PREDICTED: O-glucosyltransferase rumi homolog [Ipomoea nil]|uniref:O-glucosyltransferase rumi homolog n=1 Tax=Ipomoea nil TaxID=35883 RepID=UPI000900D9A1|nr:PREDICTED: O-glucosyltransferase rumi homolog [Ipomoea nil]
MVMRGKTTAAFRLVIVNGSAYVDSHFKAFQSRDTLTVWGILQLLRRYPGKIPDLELMFDCEDEPAIQVEHFRGPNATAPPPLFTFCADDSTFDIPFPDWSFWGWPELHIRPWEVLLKELQQGNERIKWVDREPYAFWKGNPFTSINRMNLFFKCNVSEYQDWGARLYNQNWTSEEQEGFNHSNLANQCTHQYKIYIEGRSWSVSQKYILGCNSPTLVVNPRYFDFFSRGLMPMKHYWPIRDEDTCRSIKHAVEWGKKHPKHAQQIGNGGSKFLEEELKMEYVYDYMFHLLSEYSKLLKYKPSVPPQMLPLTSHHVLSLSQGLEKQFMMESMVEAPSHTPPCTMPPSPAPAAALHSILKNKQNSIHKVHSWEDDYWQHANFIGED